MRLEAMLPEPVRRAAQPLLVAAWFALAAGLLEAARHAVWRFGLDRLTWTSGDVFWIAPLSYLYLFAIPGLVLALAAAISRRFVPFWASVLVFAVPSTFGVLALLAPRAIAVWAVAIVAAGLGVQAARAVRARPARFAAFGRRTLIAMSFALALLLLAIPLGRALRQRVQQARSAAAGAPNVLFVILDTVRGRSLSLYGYGRETTPNLDRRAADGVVFENAFASAPWTLPSHVSMFTGLWPYETRAGWQAPLEAGPLTLAESLRARGYSTGAFTANLNYTGRETGLDRGFTFFREHRWTRHQLLLSSTLGQAYESWRTGWWPVYPHSHRKSAGMVTAEFLDWTSGLDGSPFFAFLNFFDAHQPYRSPGAFRSKFRGSTAQDGYDAAIAYIDHELDRLFAELERRGVLQNTIVVVTSDHGEQFGEHGLEGHGNSLYLPVLHVPLVIWRPGGRGGRRIPEFVSLRQLPATIAELTGGSAAFPGRSLVPLLDGGERGWRDDIVLSEATGGVRTPPHEPVSRGPMKSIVADPFHYIRNGDGVEELYDLRIDPAETRDLAGTAAGRSPLLRLRASLDALLPDSTAGTTVAGTGTRPAPTHQ